MDVTDGVTYRVFDVRRHAPNTFREVKSKPEWKIAPPVDYGHRGDRVTIRVVDPGSHEVEVLSDVFDPAFAVGTNLVTVTVRSDVENGQYPFEVYVDGQYVNANSAPGIIVD